MTVPDAAAFLAACMASLDDDLPRLVWADRLDEAGFGEAAAFLRRSESRGLIRAAKVSVESGSDPRTMPIAVIRVASDLFALPLANPEPFMRY